MFKSDKKLDRADSRTIDTIIGEKTVIQGTLNAEEPLRIDGTVKGEAICKSSLIVGEHGKIEGDVTAEDILIAGSITGNLHIGGRTEMTNTGRVIGDIVTKSLMIEEGASFKGNCSMSVQAVLPEPDVED